MPERTHSAGFIFQPPGPDSWSRCSKSRNIIDRLPKSLHASVRKALCQAWELDDAETASLPP
ncbi:Transposase, Mutator family (plasmid) [Acidiphilium sp. PM]|nr:Transposase, Mutator family [Acidiphilium sp. PM]